MLQGYSKFKRVMAGVFLMLGRRPKKLPGIMLPITHFPSIKSEENGGFSHVGFPLVEIDEKR